MEHVLNGGIIMDDSFPSDFSSLSQIKQSKQSLSGKVSDIQYSRLIYCCFNYILNNLKLTIDINNFFVKGSTYQATLKVISKLQAFEIFKKLYYCYNIIIRVYEFRCLTNKGVKRKSLYILFDDMTNTRKDVNSIEFEILMIDNNYYVFDQEIDYISTRFNIIFSSPNLNILSENEIQISLSKYVQNFEISDLMLYSEIKNNCAKVTKTPTTTRNIIFFYGNTFVSLKSTKIGRIATISKQQYKVLDKWVKLNDNATKKVNESNLYVFTYFHRQTREFKFAIVDLEERNQSFLDCSLKQINCELIEEEFDDHKQYPFYDDKSSQFRDECFCPSFFFPMAKSSQGRPIQVLPMLSLLERLSLADKPILDLLSFAAKISLSFYDIETLAKPLLQNNDLKEPKIRTFDDKKLSNYVHSIQEALCIGYQSLCPDFKICEANWSQSMKMDKDFDTFLNLSFVIQKKLIGKNQESFNRFCVTMKKSFEENLNDIKAMLDNCFVFELCNNASNETSRFVEPNMASINEMVSDWLDLVFRQASICQLVKQIILAPLFEHISKSTNAFKRRGYFATLDSSLRALINNFYVFGYV